MPGFSSRNVVRNLSLIGMLAACFMLRPAAGGQSLTPVALLLITAVVCVELINRKFLLLRPSTHAILVAFLGVGFWMYLALHSLFAATGRTDFVAKSMIAHTVVIATAFFLFSESESNQKFFKYLSCLLMLPIASYAVTAALACFVGFDSLLIFSMTIEDYPGTGDVLFPFTPVYTYINLPEVRLIRLSGYFRESGIAQAFYGWGFVSAPFLWRRSNFVRAVFAAGMIFTISTAGIFLLAVLLIAVSFAGANAAGLSQKKTVLRFMGILVVTGGVGFATYYVSENVPVVGLRDKEERSVSADDRYDANAGSLLYVAEYPMGKGLYSSTIPNSTINLIGSIREIGLPGFFLFLSLYLVPILVLRKRFYALLCVVPVLLTAISSQPLMDAPFAYVLLFFAPLKNFE